MGPALNNMSVLIAGCGSIGRRHARVLRDLGVEGLWACDPDNGQREALVEETTVAREFTSFEDALDARPQTVFICTPPKLHIPMSAQALQAGAHVFCEKPLADGLDGIGDLAAVVESAQKRFMVGFCFRYHEGLTKAKAYLDQGRIGRLVSIRCRMGEHLPTVRPDYRDLFTAQYSGAFDLTHEIDLACWFAGQLPITEVKALYGRLSDVDMKAPDVVEIIARFGDSCLAGIHLDFFSRPRCRVTELLGTDGTIAVEFAEWDRCTVSVYDASKDEWQVEEISTERDHMFRAEDAEFLDAVVNGSPVSLGLDEARRSLEIVHAAQNSKRMASELR